MSLSMSRRKVLQLGAGAAMGAVAMPYIARGATPVMINFGDHNAVDSVLSNTVLQFKNAVETASAGEITVRHYPAAQLGSQRELLEQVKLGTLQMCFGDPPYLSNLVPQYAVMDLPFVFRDWEHVERVVDGDVARTLGDALVASQGLRPLSWLHIGFRDMMTIDKPVTAIGDFSGLKFRSPEVASFVEMFKALGATPVPVPWGEVYPAMKTGLVDGVETTPEGMINSKLYEVGKYVTQTQHINTVGSPIVSESFWTGLTSEQQATISKAIMTATLWEREEMKRANAAATVQLKENGLELLQVDREELRKAVEPVWGRLTGKTAGASNLVALIQAA
ncbi:TRAP transporter substrate-binding protein [Mesorhizobium sp. YR577]|uniref:TRAP transporter substrate-binding protein n=1 Tax=Mesorhizobium sp. YR577 TaxID=1884373 RepID=UPI0008E3A154|nr:TRAP transporter substrate-binding protein [Mesorhizobium sp. YR577]SFU16424.1 tripartite ATP-independent transporter solute receptor, DctP family [Mesorhizobium sp. YR577]